ncbi:MAG: rhomboid family intramembrane serine protease [Saccharospirillaceae bacterium]|nr:rhomboid family intramembrane serine protease [Saccharospirillaceae bacterium]
MSESKNKPLLWFKQNKAVTIKRTLSWLTTYSIEIIIAIIGTIILLIPSWSTLLQFDRNLIAQHHYWLIITGQFTHFNFTHWVLDFIAIIIAAIHSPIGFNKQGFIQLSLSFLIVGLGIWLFGDSDYYRGISGVVYGWLLLSVLRADDINIEQLKINLLYKVKVFKFKTRNINIMYKAVFITLILLKVTSDVLGLDLFGISGQVDASISVAAHVSGLLSVLVIIPFQWRSIVKKHKSV